jgi:predicted DCC family thiol-disulfide oxidoreductase YuxK
VSEAGRATVLYDADCGFCKWSLDKLLAWDRAHRLTSVAIQSPEGRRMLAGVPEEKRLDSWHLVLPGGELRSAGAAAGPLAELLPGGRPLAALLESFPKTTDRAYRYVADHRDRWAHWLRIDSSYRIRR